jgi:hypothetical protein
MDRKMASGGFHRALRGARAWLGGVVGAGDGYAALVRRQKLKQLAIGAAVFAGFVLSGVAGYAIGSSGGSDPGAARQAGSIAAEVRGTAVGSLEGYESAFRSARERAYEAAYREAYTAAYRDEFEQADLATPEIVKVSGP